MKANEMKMNHTASEKSIAEPSFRPTARGAGARTDYTSCGADRPGSMVPTALPHARTPRRAAGAFVGTTERRRAQVIA